MASSNSYSVNFTSSQRGRHGRDGMVLGFTTTFTISAYHCLSCDLESHSCRCALDAILFDKFCQGFAAYRSLYGFHVHGVF
jgi:hypothetical protein